MDLSLSASLTDEIQKALEMVTANLGDSFWIPQAAFANGQVTREAYLEEVAALCWFYQLVVLLHLPLMICSVTDSLLEKIRVACLDAARNLLSLSHHAF